MSIENNTAGLEAILAQVNALPTGGGGGEIKTCTLRLTIDIPFEGGYDPQNNIFVGYSKLEDGVIDNWAHVELNTPLADNETILENVVSNSPIIFDVFDDAYCPATVFAYDGNNRGLDSVIYGTGQQTWVVYIPQDAQGVFDITLTEEQREPTEPEPDIPAESITFEQTGENSVTVSGVVFEQQEDGTVLWRGATFAPGDENTVIIS